MPPSPIPMLQSGQVLCDQYRLVERLGRSPGRQTWRAVDLRTIEPRPQPSAERSAGATQPADFSGADPWDSGELTAASTVEVGADLRGQPGETLDSPESLPESSPELLPELLLESGGGETVILKLLAFSDEIDWGQVKLFEREAAVLKGLTHPALPRYRDSFSLEDRLLWFGLVQDDIPGQSLDQLLAEGGTRLDEAQLRHWAEELLEILIYLHGQSPPILHRDIKPSNVIWGDDQRIYLIDLGAVQDYVARASLGASFTVVGTYGYAPLEQFGGRAVPASDLYALGATLVHLLTGVAPADLPQENLRLQFGELGPGISPSITLGFRRWLQQLLEPDVQRRLPSARAALNLLRQLPQLPATAPAQTMNAEARRVGSVDDTTLFPPSGSLRQSGARPQEIGPQAIGSQAVGSQAVGSPEVGSQEIGPLEINAREVYPQPRSPQPQFTPQPQFQPQPLAPARRSAHPNPAQSPAQTRLQPGSGSLELLAAPTPAPLAPAGARLRLKRSPDLLLVELPGEELGYVFGVLGVGFSIWALLTSSATLPFCLLFTLLGIFLATPQVLRFERRGSDIHFSLGKPLGGYLLRLGRDSSGSLRSNRASGSLRQVFHTVESPRAQNSQAGQWGQNRLPAAQAGSGEAQPASPWLNRRGLGVLQSNRRTLVVQTQQREIPIDTSLSWQEGTWLVDQIYAWCDSQ